MDNMMTILESAMIATMFLICIFSSITDLKNGIVKNKNMLIGFIFAILFNVFYYVFFAKEYFLAFVLNFAVMTFLSITFYATHIWAAGDSKLLIIVISLIPARLYFSGNNVAASVNILIIIFSLAFIYYVGESIYLSIKEKEHISFKSFRIDVKKMVLQYIKCTCVVTIVTFVFSNFLQNFYAANIELFMVVNMLIVFSICNISILDKWFILTPLVVATVFILILQNINLETLNLKIYIVVAIVVVLRIIAERHNYRIINTNDTKPGMVLSYSTIVQFMPSRIKGLPTNTTEDIRSRITTEEANSIIRWKDSKYGKSSIVIVRKIPFAIFITVGSMIFVIARMVLWKYIF